MAGISAKFEADFSQFVEQAQKANKSLSDIEGTSKSVRSAVDTMISGAESLAGAFGIAFSVGAIANFVTDLMHSTAALQELSRATGVSADDLQRFQYVGKEFGVDLETMSHGVQQLSARLASGDASATRAVQMLGLSVKDLIAAGPTEAFLQIAEATGRVQDPMMKGALATDEFGGKLGKLLIPMLGELRQKLLEVPKVALISDENIEKVNTFETRVAHLLLTLKSLSLLGLADFAKFGVFNPDLISPKFLDNLKTVRKDITLVSEAFVGPVLTNAQLFANRLDTLTRQYMEPLTGAQQHLVDVGTKLGLSQKDIADSINASEGAVRHYTTALKDADAEFEQMAKAQEARDKILVEGATLADKAWTEYFANAATLYASDTDKARIAADTKYALAVKEAQDKGIIDVGYYNALWKQRDLDVAKDFKARLDSDTNSHDHYTKIAKDAQDYYEFVKGQGDRYSQEFIEQQRLIAQAATDTAVMWGLNTQAAAATAVAAIGTVTSAYYAAIDAAATLAGVVSVGNRAAGIGDAGYSTSSFGLGGLSNGGLHPLRGAGGPVSSGSSYIVGDTGPELFTPGASGFITPRGGGTVVTNNIYVNGTAAEVAQKVAAEIMRTFSAGTKR